MTADKCDVLSQYAGITVAIYKTPDQFPAVMPGL